MLPLAALFFGCSSEQDVGHRYRTERGLYQADIDAESLTLQAQKTTPEQWSNLAHTYEAAAALSEGVSLGDGVAAEQIQIIRARALFGAARAYAVSGDSLRVVEIFESMASAFGHLPEVASEVALARAEIAEGKGQLIAAADQLRIAVERTEPQPGRSGVGGVVLDLPLRIARLHARSSPDSNALSQYAEARDYYERRVEGEGDLVRALSQGKLAELEAELGNWTEAAASLSVLESMLLEFESPPREPASVRLAIAGVRTQAGASPEEVRDILTALLEEYPESESARDALMSLANNAVARGEVDEALGHLELLHEQHKEDVDVGSLAVLARARLLEREGRWNDAQAAFASLKVEYPISESALWVPLEIANHYRRVEDAEAASSALVQAEVDYRDFIDRYPPGPRTLFANERLLHTLVLQEKYELVVTGMVDLAEKLVGTPKSAALFIDAAKLAYDSLADTTRAADILDRAGTLYAHLDLGTWASKEATRLRETITK